MTDQIFVYFLPRTNDAAVRKKFFLIQRLPGYPVMIAEVASVREAVSVIRNIRLKTPWLPIILDTDCLVGRDLLARVETLFRPNPPDPVRTLYLAQLFHRVRDRIPETAYPTDHGFLNTVLSLLFSARSQGGRRPCTVLDFMLARIAVEGGENATDGEMINRLYRYPLCAVPKFFLQRAKEQGIELQVEEKKIVEEIIELGGYIARLRQSPFPISYHNWLFNVTEASAPADMKSRVDDFLYAALDGTTRQRKKCRREFPLQWQVIRHVDRFLKAIAIENASLFYDSVSMDRYERIRGFLELMLETWTLALYTDQPVKPQLVNLSRLNERHHAAFVQATTVI